jgi:SNF2-related domain
MRLARQPQVDMLRGLRRAPRMQLVASMGLGKSGALLLNAASLSLHYGGWPGLLILAPLQVALNWRNEAPLWMPDKRLVLVAGAEAERKAALQQSADITVVTYDNLPWLHKHAPGDWSKMFGRVACCDESTRIKRTRASWQTSSLGKRWLRTDGGVQTNALAEHAGDFAHWVNATGTPTPNGMVDLWGQYWYLDGGQRLGGSYTAFEQRWFMVPNRHTEFAKPVPQPGAAEQIAQMVSDITVVAKVEDYYNVAQPNVVDRVVELPEKARRQYREMRSRMSTEVSKGKVISVQSAAAKNVKMLQAAAGFMYHRDEDLDPDLQLCEELHSAKLDAIDSILEETGEPLVVVYFFKATLQMMRKKFKNRLRELDDKGKAQDDWNAGKVEILAIQYSSGSMGLSLQHGGRNICLVSPTYRADDYAQILERLGPLRQMQSGYNRVVNVFRIIAAATEDARVFDVATGKLSWETAMINFIQGAQNGK